MYGSTRLADRFGGKTRWGVIAGALLLLAVPGCGGRDGGGSGGDGDGDGDDGPVAADISLQASGVRLASSGDNPVEITALLRDSNNNVVEGAEVTFSADSGALQTTQATTDASGRALAELTPAEAGNRTITVTAAQGDDEAAIDIEVFGTELSINGPASLNPDTSGTYTATLEDSSGDPISGEVLEIQSAEGNSFQADQMDTDSNGKVEFELTAETGNDDTITVSALGATATLDIEVSSNVLAFTEPAPDTTIELGTARTVTVDLDRVDGAEDGHTINVETTRGNLSDERVQTGADGTASFDIQSDTAGPATISASASVGDTNPTTSLRVEFVATEAASLNLQAEPTQIAPTESSTITARVRDPNGNLVANQTVTFNLEDVTTGELDRSSAETDSQGRASTVYTASSSTSSEGGVRITAKVRDTSPTVQDDVELTVGGDALRLSMNTGNVLEEPSETRYEEPWTVLVTDASGNPITNADVELSINPLAYFKGAWVAGPDAWAKGHASANPDNIDTSGDYECEAEDYREVPGLDPEVTRFNGQIDENEDTGATEDFDGDGSLEPENPATVAPGTVTTDDSGFADFVVAYPQGNATWTRVRLEAAVAVAGSESTETREFVLRVLADDIDDTDELPPGGTDSPYGLVGDCTNPE